MRPDTELKATQMLRAGRTDDDVLVHCGITLQDILGLRGALATAQSEKRHGFNQSRPQVAAFGLRSKREDS